MAAPKPTPTALKLIKGNPGKRALNKNEPKKITPVITTPGHMDQLAKTVWKKTAKTLDQLGVLSDTDLQTLENYCETYARIRRLRAEIKGLGSTAYQSVKPDGEVLWKAYPQVSQLDSAERNFRSFAVELGLTPAARTKVQAKEQKDDNDPLEKYGI